MPEGAVRPPLTREEVLGRAAYFARVQVWQTEPTIDPRAWLSNFHDAELPHALS